MKPKRSFVWCDRHEQRRFVNGCLECKDFPCAGFSLALIQDLSDNNLIHEVLATAKKTRKPMFFLVYTDKIEPYEGVLEKLPLERAEGVQKAHEVSFCLEMQLRWVPEGKSPKPVNIPGAGKQQLCVVEEEGQLVAKTIDPAQVGVSVTKIYPVQKTYVRQFVPLKVSLDNSSVPQKKTVSSRKKV